MFSEIVKISIIFLDLDFGALATSFGLLRLPKMPELKNRKIIGFISDKTDMNAISYV
jgi:ATP-dependent RNA helicase DDX55/SPB4